MKILINKLMLNQAFLKFKVQTKFKLNITNSTFILCICVHNIILQWSRYKEPDRTLWRGHTINLLKKLFRQIARTLETETNYFWVNMSEYRQLRPISLLSYNIVYEIQTGHKSTTSSTRFCHCSKIVNWA